MYEEVVLKKYKENDGGTELLVAVPGKQIGRILTEKRIKKAELRIDDGRGVLKWVETSSDSEILLYVYFLLLLYKAGKEKKEKQANKNLMLPFDFGLLDKQFSFLKHLKVFFGNIFSLATSRAR